ncbi:hypothetical protein C5748_25795 [Phyllobacterium phragmitis]|uniref:Uncharacterized protein n=1 Tax=Phyllobacterium phragmitis TaxID=2670329 RepID=A0A2S9IJH4_9HYPH|nr:hypothetical protein [Phyllobacterium phragmitis]PRD40680.1 hypothetical protein C5748_25795 [Phyllobacterium phragmitis]
MEPRPSNTIYRGRNIARLLRRYGQDHVGLIFRCIQASDPTCFYSDVLWAVSRYLKAHHADDADRQRVIKRFSGIDLSGIRKAATRAAMGEGEHMTKRADAMAVMIWMELDKGEAA